MLQPLLLPILGTLINRLLSPESAPPPMIPNIPPSVPVGGQGFPVLGMTGRCPVCGHQPHGTGAAPVPVAYTQPVASFSPQAAQAFADALLQALNTQPPDSSVSPAPAEVDAGRVNPKQ